MNLLALPHNLLKVLRIKPSQIIKQSLSVRHTSTDTATSNTDEKKEKKVTGPPELAEKKWALEFHQPGKGKIAGKIPIKIRLEKGKRYKWCTCGHSKNQPFCDWSHRWPKYRTELKPMTFKAPDNIDVWLCTCKQSSNRPFCDGTHRNEEIQEAIRI